MYKLILIGVSNEAEIDLRSPDSLAILLLVEFPLPVESSEDLRSKSLLPVVLAPRNGYGKLARKTAKGLGAVVIRRTNKGDLTVAITIRPPRRRRKVKSRLIRSLDLDDVPRPPAPVVTNILIPLDNMKIVVRNVLHVEPPARIPTRTEGIVDHVTDGSDTEGTQTIKRSRTHREKLVCPKDIGLLLLRQPKDVTIDAVDRRAGSKSKSDLAKYRIARLIIVIVQRDYVMAETLQRPQAIERGVIYGEARSIENLHPALV
jgi:hypothetical protein